MKEKMKNVFTGKRGKALIGTVLVAVIAIGGVSVNANSAMRVNSYKAQMGELTSTLELNGKVESNLEKTFFAQVDGKIGKISVEEGDFVKQGDVMISYDSAELERLMALVEYGAEADLGSYNNSMQTDNRTAGLYNEATRNLKVLDQQITDFQSALNAKEQELVQKRAALADEGAKLQMSLIELADQPDSEEYQNLTKLIESNAYDQQYSPELIRIQNEINDYSQQLAGFKEYKAEMTSQKAATQMGLMTKGEKEQLEAVKAANELTSNDKKAKYENASQGVKSEFDGIVTSISVAEGCSVGEGMQLVTVKSIDDIIVNLNVNKYDIVNIEEGQPASVTIKNKEYAGKVSRISRIADEQQSGISVEVKLDAPDGDIILGIETKAKIQTAQLETALVVPTAALWEDEEGTFVTVAKDGKAHKTAVETGARSTDMAEIVSGINAGDVVVWNDSSEIKDGASVKID